MSETGASIRTQRIYQTETDLEQIRSDLASIGEIDAQAEGLQKRWGWIALWSGLGAVGAFVATVAGLLVVLPVLIGFIVMMIVALVIRSRHGHFNFDNRRYLVAQRLASLLATDMDPPRFGIRIDLRPADSPAKFVSEQEVRGWKCKNFVDPWLTLSGKLADGNSFQFTLTEKMQVRKCWRRGRSGKMKQKVKRKAKHVAALQLKVKPHKYPALADLGKQGQGAVQLPAGASVTRYQAGADHVVLHSTIPSGWDDAMQDEAYRVRTAVDLGAMMFVSCYQVLTLARAIRKAKEKAPA